MSEDKELMLFHKASETVYNWLLKQSNVKEESLTDWLLFFISENSTNIYYKEFTRHKEANNGADWEWWVLTSGYDNSLRAYRFLVQAKKLVGHGRDNYPLLSYGNRNGYQIDLLMKSAKYKYAFPLYMYYSISPVDIDEQFNDFLFIDKSIIGWCENCVNGCYLSPASKVYSELYNKPRHTLKDSDLLNKSLIGIWNNCSGGFIRQGTLRIGMG